MHCKKIKGWTDCLYGNSIQRVNMLSSILDIEQAETWTRVKSQSDVIM